MLQSMLQSIEHERRECLSSVSTIADGIAVKEPENILLICVSMWMVL